MARWILRVALTLTLIALVIKRVALRPPSQGLAVRLVTTECDSDSAEAYVSIQLRLQVAEDGRTFLNGDDVPAPELPGYLSRLYSTRNQRVLFLDAADSVSYQKVVTLLNDQQAAVEGLSVVLLTPSVRKRCEWLWSFRLGQTNEPKN